MAIFCSTYGLYDHTIILYTCNIRAQSCKMPQFQICWIYRGRREQVNSYPILLYPFSFSKEYQDYYKLKIPFPPGRADKTAHGTTFLVDLSMCLDLTWKNTARMKQQCSLKTLSSLQNRPIKLLIRMSSVRTLCATQRNQDTKQRLSIGKFRYYWLQLVSDL